MDWSCLEKLEPHLLLVPGGFLVLQLLLHQPDLQGQVVDLALLPLALLSQLEVELLVVQVEAQV